MSKIFEDNSDSDVEIKTDNEYAKNYDKWRKKEELNRLKTKYGEDLSADTSSSSSDDDEEGVEFTEEVEKQFFKTLACLKNKDPRIYDENIQFFDNNESQPVKKSKKEKPMYINDYERELILNNGAISGSDEEVEEDLRSKSPTYVEEQKRIRDSFKKALNQVTEDDDDGEWGGMLKVRQKTEEEKIKEENDYKEWLSGQKDNIDNKEDENELRPLKDYWNDPDLEEGEKFLRDYILQKKFLSKESEDYIPTYEEIIHDSDKDLSEDDETISKQEEFEHKYNFRFEEPDQEFIKRYPRTMEHSLRKTDDKRKIKRAETKERKQTEKKQKMQELKKLQELKRKEIEEKIEKLREVTGNDDLQLQDDDLEGDFDPEAHDRRMQSLFNDEFYQAPEDDNKPEFPDLDEYLEIENWKEWQGDEDTEAGEDNQPHCEDEDFNMDCDYDPKSASKQELIENCKGRKKRKRKSLFAKAVTQPKPVFDPKDKTYQEYLDEYYKLDCEDIIGDIPCRFKYRKVAPNSFGLTIEEILTANDRELNKWCSLKKAVQHRSDEVEKYDQIAYSKKAKNLELKKKLLPSLFENEEFNGGEEQDNKKKKKMKKVRCKKGVTVKNEITEESVDIKQEDRKKKKKKTLTITTEEKNSNNVESDVKLKKKKTQDNFGNVKNDIKETEVKEESVSEPETVKSSVKQKKKKKKQNKNSNSENTRKRKLSGPDGVCNKKSKKESKGKNKNIGISDARLSAYGINPKKFKNKLKYGKTKG